MSRELILYRQVGACSFIPHALLNELNISFPSIVLKFEDGLMTPADGSFSNAEFKKVHPRGFVPALKVEEQVITEMPAVLTYISDLAPEKQLLGTMQMERAKSHEWMAWLAGTLHGLGYGALWRPQRFTDDDTKNIHKAISDEGLRTIMYCHERVEETLKGLHAIGDRFTAVDLNLYNFYRWGALRIGLQPGEMTQNF